MSVEVVSKGEAVTLDIGAILIPALFLGLIPACIAKSKGREFFLWYLYGVLLFIVALIHSLIIKPTDRQLINEGMKKCPHCAEIIKPDAKVCRYCGRDLPEPINKSKCPLCGAMLNPDYRKCTQCGHLIEWLN